jgi:hypothetical protein
MELGILAFPMPVAGTPPRILVIAAKLYDDNEVMQFQRLVKSIINRLNMMAE